MSANARPDRPSTRPAATSKAWVPFTPIGERSDKNPRSRAGAAELLAHEPLPPSRAVFDSGAPSRRGAWVGKVGAVRAGTDGVVEMFAELGKVLRDPNDGRADRPRHTHTGALGRGSRSSSSTAQAERA